MADLLKEDVRRLRCACRNVTDAIRAIRTVQTGLGSGPAYRECRKGEALAIPDAVDASVFEAACVLDRAVSDCLGERIAEAREALAFARAAIVERQWDDANKDLNRCLYALGDIERRIHRELPNPFGWLRATVR